MTRRTTCWCLSIAATVACLLLSACSIEKHHRTLSFFFDGVPDPNAPEPERRPAPESVDMASLTSSQRAAMLGRKIVAPEVTFHEPVRARNCQGCHEGGGVTGGSSFSGGLPTLLDEPPKLCWRCHEPPQHERAHGPAAVGACLLCHLPHQSMHKRLLRMPEAELCGSCHDSEVFVTAELHTAAGAEQCTQCHGPHGSDRPFFLLSDAPDSLGGLAEAEVDEEPEPEAEGQGPAAAQASGQASEQAQAATREQGGTSEQTNSGGETGADPDEQEHANGQVAASEQSGTGPTRWQVHTLAPDPES